LKIAKSAMPQIPPQPVSLCVLCHWQIKQHQPPMPVPSSLPTGFRVSTAQRLQSAWFRQAKHAVAITRTTIRRLLRLNQLKTFQFGQLPMKPVAICPSLERLTDVAKGRARELLTAPKEEIEQFLRLNFGFHLLRSRGQGQDNSDNQSMRGRSER